MTIGKICSRTTYLAEAEESVRVAAERMRRENVGTLLVLDERRKPVGILTDRDLAIRSVAAARNADETKVAEVMTAHPRRVEEKAPIEDAVEVMRTLGVRRLPVVDAKERLVGLVSIDDVLELLTSELANLTRIVGMSQPGIMLPAATRRQEQLAAEQGLHRAASDLQC